MKITSYAVARPAYYDRNAQSSFGSYNNQVVPHGATTRVTATVAAGKKLSIEVGNIYIYRAAAATVAGQIFTQHAVTSGVTSVQLAVSSIFSNVLQIYTVANFNGPVTIYAGETYTIDTLDSSTGGQGNYSANYKGTLFDA